MASRLAFAIAAACASSAALAQDELEETIVTATRTPVKLDALDAPVIVITRQDIERSLASDVSELLQHQAGLEIARNGGPGQTTSLFTRGTESNHTVVLIDGVRINPGTIGGAALQNIAPESLERIEIVKGPRSALYGTDAIGGVVQLFTRGAVQGRRQRRRHLRQPAHAAAARVMPRCPPATASSSASAAATRESDGMPTFVDDDMDRGWRNVTGRVVRGVGRHRRAHVPRARLAAPRAAPNIRPRPSRIRPTRPVSEDFLNSVYSLESDYHARRRCRRCAPRVGSMRDDIDQNQANFAGTDFAHTRRDTARRAARSRRGPLECDQRGRAVQRREHRRAVLRHRLRREHHGVPGLSCRTSSPRASSTRGWRVGYVDHETFGSEFTWNAEFGVAFGSGTRVALSGGKAFRAPDSTDRFGFGGNPGPQARSLRSRSSSPCGRSWASTSSWRSAPSTITSTTSSTTWSRIPSPSTVTTRTSIARASRAWSWAITSPARPGVRAPSSRCRTRATKRPTSGCCAARASR